MDTAGFSSHFPYFSNTDRVDLGIPIIDDKRQIANPAYFIYTADIINSIEKIEEAHDEVTALLDNPCPYAEHLDSFFRRRLAYYLGVYDFFDNYMLAGIPLFNRCYTSIEGSQAGDHTFDAAGTVYRALICDKPTVPYTMQDLVHQFTDIIAAEPRNGDILKASPRFPYRSSDAVILYPSPDDFNNGDAFGRYPVYRCRTDNLVQRLNQAFHAVYGTENLPPFIQIALLHFFIGYIHPFGDGNGRMARFTTLSMLCDYFGDSSCLGFSSIINTRFREEYYHLFMDVERYENGGCLNEFINGFLYLVYRTLMRTQQLIHNAQQSLQMIENRMEYYIEEYDDLSWDMCYLLAIDAGMGIRGLSRDEMMKEMEKSRTPIQGRLDNLPEALVRKSNNNHPARYVLRYVTPESSIHSAFRLEPPDPAMVYRNLVTESERLRNSFDRFDSLSQEERETWIAEHGFPTSPAAEERFSAELGKLES